MLKNISVIGLGKLGYPMAQFLSSSGAKIKCYDANKELIDKLRNNEIDHLNESGINNYIHNNNDLIFENSISDCIINADIVYITVPTPSKLDGSFSNKIILQVLDEIGNFLIKKKSSIILNINSTVQPGSIENEIIPFLENKGLKNNKDFYILYNPYFVALGSVIRNLEEPDFLLIGTSSIYASKKITRFYNKLYNNPKIKLLKFKEAELSKLLINTFLTTKVSYSNFVKNICKNFENVSDLKILESIGLDHRIGSKFILPGGPYSGPCLPRDNLSLKKFCLDNEIDVSFPDEIQKINNNTIDGIFKIISKLKNDYKIKSFGFLGLGYKSNTQCYEDSYSIKMLNFLRSLDIEVFYYDPYIIDSFDATKVCNLHELSSKSDIIFLSYADMNFNPILQVDLNKNIWDMWYQFSDSKFNKVYRKEYDFKKLNIAEYSTNNKIINFKKNLA
jgi:UDPglucose 6-dehydrogenase